MSVENVLFELTDPHMTHNGASSAGALVGQRQTVGERDRVKKVYHAISHVLDACTCRGGAGVSGYAIFHVDHMLYTKAQTTHGMSFECTNGWVI